MTAEPLPTKAEVEEVAGRLLAKSDRDYSILYREYLRVVDRAEAAEARNKALEERLKPFADAADRADEGVEPGCGFADHTWVCAVDDELTVGDLRRARAELNRSGG